MDESLLEGRMRDVEQVVIRMEGKLDTALEALQDHEARLRCIEQRQGKKWDNMTSQIVGAIIGIGIGWMFAQLIK